MEQDLNANKHNGIYEKFKLILIIFFGILSCQAPREAIKCVSHAKLTWNHGGAKSVITYHMCQIIIIYDINQW